MVRMNDDLIHPDQLTLTEGVQRFVDTIGKFQREGQSATSQVAAVQAAPLTGKSRIAVFEFISGRGIFGATDEEIQEGLGMNPSTQRPRRVELVEAGLIEDCGDTRMTRSRRPAVVWVRA